MPEAQKIVKVDEVAETASQPWKAIWPAPESDANIQMEKKAASNSGNGRSNGRPYQMS